MHLPVIGCLGAVEVGDSDGNGFVVHGERPHAAVVHRRRLEVIPDWEKKKRALYTEYTG